MHAARCFTAPAINIDQKHCTIPDLAITENKDCVISYNKHRYKTMKTIQPLNDDSSNAANPAADLIRQKLSQLYGDEPDAKEELQEAKAVQAPRSKHQQFMYELSQSGKSLADIQTALYYDLFSPESAHPKHLKHALLQTSNSNS